MHVAPPAAKEDADKAYREAWRDRWHMVVECVPDFEAAANEAEALWGTEIARLTGDFSQLIWNYQVELDMHLRHDSDGRMTSDPTIQEFRRTVFGTDDDDFGKKMNARVEKLAQFCRSRMPTK